MTGQILTKENRTQLIDDPRRRQPDISKAKHLLDWEPVVDFATGMQKMLDSYGKK